MGKPVAYDKVRWSNFYSPNVYRERGQHYFCLLMTSADRNDQIAAKKKLEWVTPKISLMDAGETFGKQTFAVKEYVPIGPQTGGVGPS